MPWFTRCCGAICCQFNQEHRCKWVIFLISALGSFTWIHNTQDLWLYVPCEARSNVSCLRTQVSRPGLEPTLCWTETPELKAAALTIMIVFQLFLNFVIIFCLETVYRLSFDKSYSEMRAPTGEWKYIVGGVFAACAVAIFFYGLQKKFSKYMTASGSRLMFMHKIIHWAHVNNLTAHCVLMPAYFHWGNTWFRQMDWDS